MTRSQREVLDAVDKWMFVLGLDLYTPNVRFVDEERGPNDEAAIITTSTQYHTVDIQVFGIVTERYTALEREFTILHELVHVLLQPLKSVTYAAALEHALVLEREIVWTNETVTDHVARVIWRLHA